MKLTQTLKREITKAVKRACRQGAVKEIELGFRNCAQCKGGECSNSLHWDEYDDLNDTWTLAAVTDLTDNACLLDCYCYNDEGLIDNVYVAIANGRVVYASDNDLTSTADAWMAIDAASVN